MSAAKSVEGVSKLTNPLEGEVFGCQMRPVGRKISKASEQKKADTAKRISLAAGSVSVQRKQNKPTKRHYEILLFANAPPGCYSSQSVEHFNIMLSRAFTETRQQEESNDDQSLE